MGDEKERPGRSNEGNGDYKETVDMGDETERPGRSNEGNGDYKEPDEGIPDTLDRKLDHVSIIKIDTNLFEQGADITAGNHFKHAERIIKQIVKTKRKYNEIPLGPREKKLKLDSKAADKTDSHIPLDSVPHFTSDTESSPAPVSADIPTLTTTSDSDIHVAIANENKQAISAPPVTLGTGSSPASVSADIPTLNTTSDSGIQEDIAYEYHEAISNTLNTGSSPASVSADVPPLTTMSDSGIQDDTAYEYNQDISAPPVTLYTGSSPARVSADITTLTTTSDSGIQDDIACENKQDKSAPPVTLDTGSSQAPVSADISPLTTPSDSGIHADIAYEYKQDISEIKLKPSIQPKLKAKEVKYELKLYLVEGKQESSFSKTFAELVTEKSRRRLCREREVSKSYILFFYRNVECTSGDTTDPSFHPEIFAITTGSAWQIVSKYADKDFTKSIEKRTLQFSLQYIERKPDGGLIKKETDLARPGHEIIFTIWDVLGKLIGKRTRMIRKGSSLYANSLDAFLTKDGKQLNSKFSISKTSMKIMCKLSIPHLGSILDHFSKIYMGKETYLLNGKVEEDDPRFGIYDFTVNITDEELIQNLNKHLYTVLQESMKREKSSIFLNHQSLKWTEAEEFHLSARTLTKTKEVSKKRRNIGIWYEYPSLDEIMECLRDNCGDEFEKEWLDDVMIKFCSIKAPLKECIFNSFSTPAIGTYIYNHGVWVEMKAQYLYHIERDFVEQMKSHFLEASQLPLLLPWQRMKEKRKPEGTGNNKENRESKKTGKIKGNDYNVQNIDMKQMMPRWKKHFEKVCARDQFDKVLNEAERLPKGEFDPTPNFQSLMEKSAHEKAAHLYRILECKMEESHYNVAHTLLNMILPDNSRTHVITLDKKTPHGIELCDILIYDDKITYLVHVKAGFGETIRVVCSQIRNAADNIYRIQKMSKGIKSNQKDLIDEYWETLTKTSSNSQSHENEVKRCLENMTKEIFKELFHSSKEIVFVLACRDTRKNKTFSQEIPSDLEIQVTDEIRKVFSAPTEYSAIISKLKSEGYLTDNETLTDKFILEGKDVKEKFTDKIKCWDIIGTNRKAEDVFEALVSGLPKSKSTIAKMEIIRLVQDFKKYSVDKFRLKIYDISQVIPD